MQVRVLRRVLKAAPLSAKQQRNEKNEGRGRRLKTVLENTGRLDRTGANALTDLTLSIEGGCSIHHHQVPNSDTLGSAGVHYLLIDKCLSFPGGVLPIEVQFRVLILESKLGRERIDISEIYPDYLYALDRTITLFPGFHQQSQRRGISENRAHHSVGKFISLGRVHVLWIGNLRCRITVTRQLGGFGGQPQVFDLLGGELNIHRRRIFIEVFDRPGSGDGNYLLSLGQQPCQADLRWSAVVLSGQGLDLGYELQDGGEVFARIFGCEPAEVVLREIVKGLDLPREQSAAHGGVGNDRDAELAARIHDLELRRLDVEAEQTVFHLHGSNRMHGVCPADCCG